MSTHTHSPDKSKDPTDLLTQQQILPILIFCNKTEIWFGYGFNTIVKQHATATLNNFNC